MTARKLNPMPKIPPRPPKGRPRPAGAGRKKGVQNNLTTSVKMAVVHAAMLEGQDGKGKGKLIGYLRSLAKNHPTSFAALLARVIPLQVEGDPDKPFQIVISHEDSRVG